MADPNLPPPPPGYTLDAPQGSSVYGLPRTPAPQTDAQARQDQLQVTHLGQEVQAQPLQNENTQANIAQSHASISNQRFNQNQGLRQEFNNLPEVKNYSVALQSLGTAFKAPDTPQGDLAIIYAYAKAADPGSVVREGEMDMANATASLPQQYRAAAQRLTQGKRLPPEVRVGLIETMRQSVLGMRQVYDQQRNRYASLAQQNGFDPKQIVGDPLYKAYGPSEEQYVRSHGGTPRVDGIPVHNGVPVQQAPQGEGDIGFNTPNQTSDKFSPQQVAAYDAWTQANRNATPQQFHAFLQSMNMNIENEGQILQQLHKGQPFDPNVSSAGNAVDPRAKALADQYMQQGGGQGAAFTAGAADAASLGSADELGGAGQALVDSLGGKGSFSDNYGVNSDANRLYEQQLQAAHGPTYLAGQVLGGAAIPAGGATSVADLAKAGAAAGGAYGFNSGEGTLGNRLTGMVEGGIAGSALGAAAGGASRLLKRAPQQVPSLLDPQTGALNQPLEAMSPGQRVVHAEEYGINLPADAAGGRTAAVIGKGLDIMPGSAGVMEDARRATESQVAGASDVVASRFGQSRTMNEAGSELQRGANAHMDRAKQVISHAYQVIPIPDGTGAALSNARATLEKLTSKFQSNPELAAALRDSKLGSYLSALTAKTDVVPTGLLDANGKAITRTVTHDGELSWRDLKDFRSRIGEMIGDHRFGEGHSTKDLRALYAALSEDMRNTASAQGPGALRAFERANTLNRQNEAVIQGALTRILGKDGHLAPEKAAAAVQAMTKGGKSTGDLKTLAQIRAATIKSGAWNEIASTLIRLGGQPANSAGRDFNPQTFVHWYADMAEPARRMLFGNTELRKALDGFVAVNQRLQKVNALRNTSQTAGSLTAAGTVGTMAAALTNPMLGVKLAGVMAGNFTMAKAWTNPAFVRLITGYSKAVASGNQNAVRSQIGRLSKLAATNPDLREPLIALQQRLANDNFAPSVAASQSDQGNSDKDNR